MNVPPDHALPAAGKKLALALLRLAQLARERLDLPRIPCTFRVVDLLPELRHPGLGHRRPLRGHVLLVALYHVIDGHSALVRLHGAALGVVKNVLVLRERLGQIAGPCEVGAVLDRPQPPRQADHLDLRRAPHTLENLAAIGLHLPADLPGVFLRHAARRGREVPLLLQNLVSPPGSSQRVVDVPLRPGGLCRDLRAADLGAYLPRLRGPGGRKPCLRA